MKKAKVSVRGLVKRFGTTTAADNIDLDIEDGEFLTLLGSSGCGKTTLMRIIAGFETADAGTVTIDGRDVTHLPPRQRRLGMVFQQYSLFPHMTVGENIGYGLRAQRAPEPDIEKRVTEMLALVQLPDLRDRKPGQLSGGQQQRVALARALATRPSVLMLDEPLGALDLKLRRQLQAELKRIHRETGTTFLFVTHDQEEALYLSDRVAVMRGGKIEQLASPQDIYLQPVNEFVADFVGDVAFIDGIHDPGLRVVILPQGSAIPARLALPAGPVRLAVRPENVKIASPGADTVPGVVIQVAHQTGTTIYNVRLASGQEVKVRSLGLAGGVDSPGQAVHLSFADCHLAFGT
ncbi:ABC transporter ATP-binding protein [Lacisediminimonas profundi]|uniref:ABC transporter ATP-binding protein n=1 Tax=Lacisediminimonas profundi TaxID=2603856 RepID=UPI00124BB90B|nr:ABC transporter ATP-binding protein [Lacisediminimonas profundi]